MGYLKYKISDREFEIDLKTAAHSKTWRPFVALIESAVQKGNEISIGTKVSWNRVDVDVLKESIKLFFPGYSHIGELKDVPTDKVFTINFNIEIDTSTVNEKSIELVNSRSGDRVLIKTQSIDEYRVKVIPQETLSIGQTYYLIIHPSIMSKSGTNLNHGTITKVTVSK